jgi:hypothetical protein
MKNQEENSKKNGGKDRKKKKTENLENENKLTSNDIENFNIIIKQKKKKIDEDVVNNNDNNNNKSDLLLPLPLSSSFSFDDLVLSSPIPNSNAYLFYNIYFHFIYYLPFILILNKQPDNPDRIDTIHCILFLSRIHFVHPFLSSLILLLLVIN